jgi:hypothetical protein
MKGIDRYWHLPWTTYGQWLPGDERGSVTRIRLPNHDHRTEEDQLGTLRTPPIRGLTEAATKALVGPPVLLKVPRGKTYCCSFTKPVNMENGW